MNGTIFSMLVVIVAFFALVWWVFKPSNKNRFNEYANIPLEDDTPDDVPQTASKDKAAGKGESA